MWIKDETMSHSKFKAFAVIWQHLLLEPATCTRLLFRV